MTAIPKNLAQTIRQAAALIPQQADVFSPPPPNPYRLSFLKFWLECVVTIDRARGGEVRKIPTDADRTPEDLAADPRRWDTYWEDWDTALFLDGPVSIDKVRRVMASNIGCAFILWLLSGGQDERWPALQRSVRNRSVLLQAQEMGKSEKDEGCSAEFISRMKQMYEAMVENGIREGDKWPDFPTWEFGFGWGECKALNSKVVGIPEGADQVRGPGTTLLWAEEISIWVKAGATLGTAIAALAPEGRLRAPSTPRVGSFADDIYQGRVPLPDNVPPLPEPPKLKGTSRLFRAGAYYVFEIRGERDVPGWKRDWFGGMPKNVFRAEVLGDHTATTGRVVYDGFQDKHEGADLTFDPKRPLLLGWDFAGTPWPTGTPAVVIAQLDADDQLRVLREVIPAEDEPAVGILEFAWWVAEVLTDEFAMPAGKLLEEMVLRHIGDPAGGNRIKSTSAATRHFDGKSSYDVIRDGVLLSRGTDERGREVSEHRPGPGWRIEPGRASLTERLETVRARLAMDTRKGRPRLLVDRNGCPLLVSGFRGLYQYRQRADGRFELDPDKTHASHGINALEYLATRLTLMNAPAGKPAANLTRRPAGVR